MLVLVGDRLRTHLAALTGGLRRPAAGADAGEHVDDGCRLPSITPLLGRRPSTTRRRASARDRLQMAVATDARTGVDGVEACAAAPDTRRHRAGAVARRPTSLAAGTPVAVGEDVRPPTPAGQRGHARTRKPPTSPSANSASSGTGCHASSCRWPSARSRVISDSAGYHPGARVLFRRNDFDRGDLGCGGTDRVLDRQLQRHRRRRAALAAALELEADHTVVHPEQRHVAAVRTEVGPHAVQRVGHPALDAVRMQPVHQQQAGDEVVGREPVREVRIARPTPRPSSAQHRPVEVGHLTDELLRAFPRDGAAR